MQIERLILGVETSCDESAASIVSRDRVVYSNVVAAQEDLHAEYSGVVPEIASRAHAERILPVVRRALAEAGVHYADLAAVAVGHRPGLIGSLLVGVAAAKALAWSLDVPLVGVDHVQAHLHAASLRSAIQAAGPDRPDVAYPAIGLVVSGGHTALYRMDAPWSMRRLGSTLDDAVGEAYDKVAAVLGLPFPGGPNLDRLAREGGGRALDEQRGGFPLSRVAPGSLDFSFSGLKTAAIYAYRGVPEVPRTRAKRIARGESPERPTMPAADVAACFQHAAVATLVMKLERALDQHPSCRCVIIGGGVSANSALRAAAVELAARCGLPFHLPEPAYCTDNAAMIAGCAAALLEARGWTSDPLTLQAEPTSAL